MTKKELGDAGEKIALAFLLEQGYCLLAKNFNTAHGEIDLVMFRTKQLSEIVFVEVKTRTNQNYGWPETAVDGQKKSRMKYAAEEYLRQNKHSLYKNYRFDVVAVIMDLSAKEKPTIEHFKNI
ncbi:MAG TPA: YraN family protein [bacterium]|nr:YraN family protein [bacterium]HPL95721.1 YraN family protein [bacterium]